MHSGRVGETPPADVVVGSDEGTSQPLQQLQRSLQDKTDDEEAIFSAAC